MKTWTTDAFFRETRGKVEKRLKQGCSVVEMECAAMATVAAFRNVKFAQFMWAADSLSGEKWDARNLNKLGTDAGEIYMEAAIRILPAQTGNVRGVVLYYIKWVLWESRKSVPQSRNFSTIESRKEHEYERKT